MMGMPVAGMLISRRWDSRRLLFFGSIVTAAGTFALSFLNLNAGPWDFLIPQLVIGLGLSFTFVPLATITVDPIPAADMGYATSIIALMRNVGGGLGISAVTTLVARRQQFHHAILASGVGLYDAGGRRDRGAARGARARGRVAGSATNEAVALVGALVSRQALAMSYLDAFRVLGDPALRVSAPLVWIMQRRKTDALPVAAE